MTNILKVTGTFSIYSPILFHRKMKKKLPAVGSHKINNEAARDKEAAYD